MKLTIWPTWRTTYDILIKISHGTDNILLQVKNILFLGESSADDCINFSCNYTGSSQNIADYYSTRPVVNADAELSISIMLQLIQNLQC